MTRRTTNGALKSLNSLYNPDKLTEYEQANVLNYLGFVYYNMDDTKNAIRTYEKMLAIPTLEPQMAKQTTYTMAQLLTMEEQLRKGAYDARQVVHAGDQSCARAVHPEGADPLQPNRYKEMIPPIENAMRVARERGKPVKEDWYGLAELRVFPAGKLRARSAISRKPAAELAEGALLEVARRRVHRARRGRETDLRL